MRFVALQTFWSPETRSQYVEGYGYNLTSPELADLVSGWIVDGKVSLANAPASKMKGIAHVGDPPNGGA